MSTNELYHFGIKGQKWGVRRYQNRDGSYTSAGKKRKRVMSDDAREAYTINKKHRSEMSNAELRKVNERIRLEQEYSRLNPSKIKKGLAYVGAVAGVLGTISTLYENTNRAKKAIDAGKDIVEKMLKK